MNLKKHFAQNLIMDQGTAIKADVYDEPKKAFEAAQVGGKTETAGEPQQSTESKVAETSAPETGEIKPEKS